MENMKEYIKNQRDISSTSKNEILGVTTGLNQLNFKMSGYKNKELNLIASRVGYGKTSLALTSVISNLNDDNGVLYFSMDLSKEELLTRIISMQSGIPLPMLKRGIIDEDSKNDFNSVVEKLSSQKLFVDDTKYSNIDYIKNESKKMVDNKENNIKIIVIDYFDLIENDNDGNIARELKKLAIKLDIPILLLSQLSNKVEKRTNQRPILSDLKSDLEIEADTILFIYIDDFVLENRELDKELKHEMKGKKTVYKSVFIDKPIVSADIIVSKQLNGISGSGGKYNLNKETSLFYKEPIHDQEEANTPMPPRFDKIMEELADFKDGYKYSKGLPYKKDEHKDIKVLDAYELKLKKIPSEILQLNNIEILRIQNNRIKQLPDNIQKFEKLEALCLCNNKLKILPNTLIKLKKLNELGICSNPTLTKLPDNFFNLKLTALSIDGNLVNKYIDQISQITTLKELEIHGGLLSKEVFIKLAKLPKLEDLTFESMDNKKIPKKLGIFNNLKYFTIKNSINFKPYDNNITSKIFNKNIISIEINKIDLLFPRTDIDLSIPDIF